MATGKPDWSSAKETWHDRNPVQRLQSYSVAAVAPHGLTERWTYTVPAGTKTALEIALLMVTRDAAATTVGLARATIFYTPSGGSEEALLDAALLTNTVGDQDRAILGASAVLLPGDLIRATTIDASTGGTINYVLTAKIVDFDA